VGYLHLHPAIPLTFNRSLIPKEISLINFTILDPLIVAQVNVLVINIIPTRANISCDSKPVSFTSCDDFHLFHADSKCSLPATQQLIAKCKSEISQISPPITECLVNENLPGRLYERLATSGGSIEMGGTTVLLTTQKQTTMAESSEAEIAAGAYPAWKDTSMAHIVHE
jgi:hypothetical protein